MQYEGRDPPHFLSMYLSFCSVSADHCLYGSSTLSNELRRIAPREEWQPLVMFPAPLLMLLNHTPTSKCICEAIDVVCDLLLFEHCGCMELSGKWYECLGKWEKSVFIVSRFPHTLISNSAYQGQLNKARLFILLPRYILLGKLTPQLSCNVTLTLNSYQSSFADQSHHIATSLSENITT